MRVASIVGARPQFIKASVVSKAWRAMPGGEEFLIHTGQHYDKNMSKVFFDELEIPRPDFNLEIGSGTHGSQTGRMLESVERVLADLKPDCVLVYGDTNSTLAGALAAAKLHVPVAHVEAGLRSFNRSMPEEINRVVADHLSDLLFAPTGTAVFNLRNEGISKGVHLVGDVMYDAALRLLAVAEKRSTILSRLTLPPRGYGLATIHRAENTDDPERLRNILKGLGFLTKEFPVVFPVHPRTRRAMDGGFPTVPSRLVLIEPVSYLDMLALESQAQVILTDSGGVQKEAFFFRVPCVTLREETEWVETVEAGWNVLVGADPEKMIAAALNNCRGDLVESPYGNGDAAAKVAGILAKQLEGSPSRDGIFPNRKKSDQ